MHGDRPPSWVRRVLWLIALWLLGVAAAGALALVLKWSLRTVGLGG